MTAYAGDFWTLFGCRVMVGVGEATLGPAAISLLSDYFPAAKRATVTSIYSMGIAIGAGCAALLGGYFSAYGWRTAFMIVGFPGIVFAVLVYFLKEPPKGGSVILQDLSAAPQNTWKRLLSNKAFLLLCLGYALFGLATNNLSIWGATFFSRVQGLRFPRSAFGAVF